MATESEAELIETKSIKQRSESRKNKSGLKPKSSKDSKISNGSKQKTVTKNNSDGLTAKFPSFWIALNQDWSRLKQATIRSYNWAQKTITPAGWFLIVVLVFALSTGLLFSWQEAVAAALISAALIVIALPFLFGNRNYQIELDLDQDRIVVGAEAKARVAVENIANKEALPSLIDIPVAKLLNRESVPHLPAKAKYHFEIKLPTDKRGVIQLGPISTVLGDPLGIFAKHNTWGEAHQLYVHPETVAVPGINSGFLRDLEGNPTQKVTNSDLAFHALREYTPGDQLHHIHWKSTAKTRSLMVRQFEESRNSSLAVLLDNSAENYANEQEFELAVSAAASLAIAAKRAGRITELVTGVEVPELVQSRVKSFRSLNTTKSKSILDELTELEMVKHSTGLEEIASLISKSLSGTAMVAIVTGSVPSYRQLLQTAQHFPAEIQTIALIADPGVEPSFKAINGLEIVHLSLISDLKQLFLRQSG